MMKCASDTCTAQVPGWPESPVTYGWRMFKALWYCTRCYQTKKYWN